MKKDLEREKSKKKLNGLKEDIRKWIEGYKERSIRRYRKMEELGKWRN